MFISVFLTRFENFKFLPLGFPQLGQEPPGTHKTDDTVSNLSMLHSWTTRKHILQNNGTSSVLLCTTV